MYMQTALLVAQYREKEADQALLFREVYAHNNTHSATHTHTHMYIHTHIHMYIHADGAAGGAV